MTFGTNKNAVSSEECLGSMLDEFNYLVNGAGYSLIVSSVSVPQRSIWVALPMSHAWYCGRRIGN